MSNDNNEHEYPAPEDSDPTVIATTTTIPVEVELQQQPWSSPTISKASTRLDITATIFMNYTSDQKHEFIETFVTRCNNSKINSVMISGLKLQKVFTNEQISTIMKSISKIHTITEYTCFHGKCNILTADLVAMSLPPKLQVFKLWNFRTMSEYFIATLRQQITIQTIHIYFPFIRQNQMKWGCCDRMIMAMCCMEHLHTLHICCVLPDGARYIKQEECILSPEAMVLLMNSTSIEYLYLENCGLLDDHMDEVCNELPTNKTLISLHMKDNLFSDDCLFTIGRLLPKAPEQFESLDVTGVYVSTAAGKVAAEGMLQNTTLLSLYIESEWASGDLLDDDEEDDDDNDDNDGTKTKTKKNHSDEEWMQQIQNQLRYNNAVHGKTRRSKQQQRHLMIPSTSYTPPRQLVVDAIPKKKTIADIYTVGDVVSVVSDNMSIVLKDVPTKANYVVSTLTENVSTISENVSTFYHQQKQKQEALTNAGKKGNICISINNAAAAVSTGNKINNTKGVSSPFSIIKTTASMNSSNIGSTVTKSQSLPPLSILNTTSSINSSSHSTKSGSPFSCSYD